MKTYFKSIAGESYLMIDNDQKKIIETSSHSSVKGINIITKESVYDRYVTDSVDTAKWSVSDETLFNAVITEVTSSI